jgi:hypothetical protein
MFDSKAKRKTIEFLKHIQVLSQSSSDRIVDGFQRTEKELINEYMAECQELIDYDEWGLGLENLLSNMYEIRFTIDSESIEKIKAAMTECKMNYENWRFIEELVK